MPNAAQCEAAAMSTPLLAVEQTSRVFSFRRRRPRADRSLSACVIEIMQRRLAEPLTVRALAREAGVSPFHFIRRFRLETGTTPHDYLRSLRLREAARLLSSSSLPVRIVGLRVGFRNFASFVRAFAHETGRTPLAYRRAGSEAAMRSLRLDGVTGTPQSDRAPTVRFEAPLRWAAGVHGPYPADTRAQEMGAPV